MKRASSIRCAALMTLAAFAMNAVLPFFAVYHLPENNDDFKKMASLFGETVLICTSEGFAWVKLEDLESGKERPQPHQEYKCPACYVAANSFKSTVPGGAEIPISVPLVRDVAYSARDDIPLLFRPQSGHPTRAPPISLTVIARIA